MVSCVSVHQVGMENSVSVTMTIVKALPVDLMPLVSTCSMTISEIFCMIKSEGFNINIYRFIKCCMS